MSILPIVKILSLLLVHSFFLLLLVALYLVTGGTFSFYWFQSFYYLFALCILLIGFSWITSSISLFIKDVSNVIGICLQFLFWLSPIFWDFDTMEAGRKMRWIMKLNPLNYIMCGYRDSFLAHQAFWSHRLFETIYFWSFTLIVLLLGVFTYKKLRPHFGDVL